ncbi:MAG: six-hairpin glycosidase-like protein, partial [Bacteroidota bacterium]
MKDRLFIEEWEVKNKSDVQKEIMISSLNLKESTKGYKGDYGFFVSSNSKEKIVLEPNESYSFYQFFGATLNEEQGNFNGSQAKQSRIDFLNECKSKLVLESPDPIMNTLFYFSKIRATESIFHSSMGLVHSPGGGNYYVGIWANDQVEYSGPFFPYLGIEKGNTAAYNAYKMFAKNIPKDDHHIAYAFEVDGNFHMTHLDRGDAAMIAYGTSKYLLARESQKECKELWPLIEWSLNYCESKRNREGAVQSESDEMEGRIEIGTANLSTSAMYYGALKQSSILAKLLGQEDKAALYEAQQKEMADVIENYFGATIEGLKTYKYFKENKLLRHWIGMPLVMGITERKEGTIKALFDKLWTENGVLVEYDPEHTDKQKEFWDRATLYSLRGAFSIGETNSAFEKLYAYSRKRLIGDHVPYAVEAYPENQMKHLSAESALYCRIFTEGLLGMELNFGILTIQPQLPEEWNDLKLRNIFDKSLDIHLERK